MDTTRRRVLVTGATGHWGRAVTRPLLLVAGLAVLAAPGASASPESGAFVVRLGRDTTGVERYTSDPRRVEIDQVGRSPRVLRRRVEVDYDTDGRPVRLTARITDPRAAAGAAPFQTVTASFTADSVLVESRRDTAVTRVRAAVPAGSIVITSSPWPFYERQTRRLASGKADTLGAPLYGLGATTTGWLSVRRLGRDSMVVETHNDRYHARVDSRGRILGVRPISGTQLISLDRASDPDLSSLTTSFLAREAAGGPMGALSPRDTLRATVAGAELWVDYSRPTRRGRTIFGEVVPYGQVWRTGANMATQIRTDRTLVMGGVEVPPGLYTLFTIPRPEGWKLMINGETGQTGTAYRADQDLFTLDLAVTRLAEPVERFTISAVPEGSGGVLRFEWDTTRAWVPFTVKP